ncbi:MAG: high-potential iron-sulfur protein [Candidatus Woesearchaeota archaeon]
MNEEENNEEICKNCKFFIDVPTYKMQDSGTCRRFPQNYTTTETAWCGEYVNNGLTDEEAKEIANKLWEAEDNEN